MHNIQKKITSLKINYKKYTALSFLSKAKSKLIPDFILFTVKQSFYEKEQNNG
jgi:hypothetical protein